MNDVDINFDFIRNVALEYNFNRQQKIEQAAKKVLNEYGYPNNVIMYTHQQSPNVCFVDISTGKILIEVRFNE